MIIRPITINIVNCKLVNQIKFQYKIEKQANNYGPGKQ